jgi:hypothetical protein
MNSLFQTPLIKRCLATASFLLLTAIAGFAGNSDLSVSVTVNPQTAAIGDEIIYTCTVTNQGPDATTAMHGYISPDDSSGNDVYMTFDTAEPPVSSIDQTGFRLINLPNIPSGGSTSFLVAYVATKAGSPVRLVGVSTDPFGDDPNPGNNSANVSVTINGASATPTPPPHGGLSATKLTVNGSTTNTTGSGQDTVLQFAALQTGNPPGLKVRVQATATPNVASSWADLPNGSGGYMTLDETNGFFVLNSLNYPLQNGMHFRAIASAPDYPDSISNVVGYYDLATTTAHVVPISLFLATNGPGQEIKFRVKEETELSGVSVRIQKSTTPGDESSWSDLADGNDGAMFPYADPTLFYLNTTKYPAGDAVYFRAIASHTGRKDSISNFVGVQHTVTGPTPDVDVIPLTEPESGHDGTADDPLVFSTGTITFGAQFFSGGTVQEIGLIYDGTVLEKRNGGTSFSLPYVTSVGGDHTFSAYAVNSLGIKGFSQPLHIRLKPAGGKVFTRIGTGGNWNEASKWHDANGATGVPGTNDIAVVGSASVSIATNASVYAVTLNGGTITGAGGGLTVSQSFAINGGALKKLDTTITSTGVVVMSSDTDVPMSGSWTNYGTFKVSGRGSIVPVPISGNTRALGAPQPNGLFDGVATFFHNIGQFFVDRLSTPPPAPTPPPKNPPPVEPPRSIVLESMQTDTKLIGPYGASLISPNGAALVGNSGGTIIGNDGASLITNDGGSLITNDGGSLITNDGGSIISNDGASLITNDGGSIQSKSETDAAAAAPAGFVQTGGETDLGGLFVASDVTLEGGVLSGSGTISGDLINSGGYVSPGHSPGSISVNGNFTQQKDGTLIVEAAGSDPTQIDQIHIGGTATLGGHLDVKLLDGFAPDPADTFGAIEAGTISGKFASVSSNAAATTDSNGLLLSVDPGAPGPQGGKPLNISTRMDVQDGDNVLIAGFIITGSQGSTKKVLIRALGPSLPLAGALADPVLELHPSVGAVVTNDNWQSTQKTAITATGIPPNNPLESAIIATLPVGAHTAIVRGKNGGTGIGLVEVYDLESDSTDVKLANISTRGRVETGDNVMIGGFIVGGSEPAGVLVRAIGPSLTGAGVTGALSDPLLELHDENGNSLTNDNWRETQLLEIEASTVPPKNGKEAAIASSLVPGNYTVVVRGKDETTGVALVEIYNLE